MKFRESGIASMHKTTARPLAHPAWRQLAYLNYYRLGLAVLLTMACLLRKMPSPLGNYDPSLFRLVTAVYFAASLLILISIRLRWPPFSLQSYAHLGLDIIAITLLMHASGGVGSGLGVLLIFAIAGGSLLMEGRTSLLFAALAALAVLAEQAYTWLHNEPLTSYTQAGLLGAGFFATAILAHTLARRVRESEALAERRGVDLANMAQLTEYVIQRMQTGIVVVDGDFTIRLINESAVNLLGITACTGKSIHEVSSVLGQQLRDWRHLDIADPGIFRNTDTGSEILPRFARLGRDKTSGGTLIFLEDMAALAQQAQQLKLASLGRLTASIAHEVRNPLAAISHASQLLAESPHLDHGDHRLTEIIQGHSERVNEIIENIMQLSRSQRAQPEPFALRPWLERFVAEFQASEGIEPARIRIETTPEDIYVHADPGQLRQILWNLCHNAFKHGGHSVVLYAALLPHGNSPFLDVVDDGPGIAPDTAQQIFEPFFTTSPNGTGMGLYVARELCLNNQARLNYLKNPSGGSRFRISFADPRRRQVA
jgi:two-component system sensor histidine kinase PilS (NtrC family)